MGNIQVVIVDASSGRHIGNKLVVEVEVEVVIVMSIHTESVEGIEERP